MTHIYIAKVLPFAREEYDKRYCTLSHESRKRVDKKKNISAANQSLYAYLLLEYALARHGVKDFAFVQNESGKPYLKDRADMFFSLSHSGERVMCVISDAEVGCDIQQALPTDLRLADRFFAPEEAEKTVDDETFYRLWTLKESLAKAKGVPLMEVCKQPFDAACKNMHFKHFVSDGYFFAVCGEDNIFCEPEFVLI